ncbi:uncharacterized protein LOC123880515 [Maniola jurtina]|uniref:uncharacterized protein LOC123880515 n=1 Tax=Maniola jurtina TaxID=191418 RepID=UPI001E68F3DD|nr:uncharacterized protein LOC123880515 [Maniola jurtina]
MRSCCRLRHTLAARDLAVNHNPDSERAQRAESSLGTCCFAWGPTARHSPATRDHSTGDDTILLKWYLVTSIAHPILLTMMICLWMVSAALARATVHEEATEELIERVLGVPDSERALNSVLGRLERGRQGLLQRAEARFHHDADCGDCEEATEELIERVLGVPDSERALNSVLGRLERGRQGLLQRAEARFHHDADCGDCEEATEELIERVLGVPDSERALNSVLGRLERGRQGLLQRAEARFHHDADCGDCEEATEELIERVLGVPDSERALNSVLGRLERGRQGLLQRAEARFHHDADCGDCEGLPEYTESVESSRDRGVRHQEAQKHDWICKVNRTIHKLNTEEYEYRPAYYEEVRCTVPSDHQSAHRHQLCSSIGLSCVQWNKSIHLTRRRYTSECWETKTLVIAAGCECMWPVHKFGAIASYLYFAP